MAADTTPEALVREAEHALTAARTAAAFLAAHPALPVTLLIAWGPNELGITTGPLLEVQIGENVDVLNAFAKSIGEAVDANSNGVDFTVTTTFDSVTVAVTAWHPVDDVLWPFSGRPSF
ncbi:hypothetical protein [Kitasatospora cineracea]|uniref:hypothetical protein n=1 Tax=Kitasatospora cineracea TaxID=88074 RepID=UPI0036C0F3FF